MNTEQQKILVRCLELTLEIPNREPPEWAWWHRLDWECERDNGPHYSIGEWFGSVPEYQRMRFRRAITSLEKQGLVSTYCRWSKLSNIALTDAGRLRADELQREAAIDG